MDFKFLFYHTDRIEYLVKNIFFSRYMWSESDWIIDYLDETIESLKNSDIRFMSTPQIITCAEGKPIPKIFLYSSNSSLICECARRKSEESEREVYEVKSKI